LVASQNYDWKKVFKQEEEDDLKDYLITRSEMGYGLRRTQCRRLVFEMAVKNGISMHPSWKEQEMAGLEWLKRFQTRHPELSLRKAEACSLGRAICFNQHNGGVFLR